jgi:hypothetical protein
MRFKTLLFGILGTLVCWFGIQGTLKAYSDYTLAEEQKKAQEKQAQDQTDLNSAISLDAEAASLMKQSVKEFNPNTWKQMIEKWEKSSQLLNGIPKNSLVYDQAQKGLIVVNSSLSYAKQKLTLEEKAQADLNLAISLDAEAAKLAKQEVNNLNADLWKQMIEKWGKSSQILATIPKNSIAYAQAQKGLIVVNSSLSTAKQNLKNEEISTSLFEKSLSISNSIFKDFDKYKRYTVVEILSLKKQGQEGLKALSGIYKSSSVAPWALQMVVYYNQNIYQLDKAISQVQKCMKENKGTYLENEDYCIVSIDIDIPNPPLLLTPDSSNLANSSDTYTNDTSDIDNNSVYQSNSNSVGTVSTYRSGSVNVRGYTRKDGTYVTPHTRSTSGTRASGFGSSRSGSASG